MSRFVPIVIVAGPTLVVLVAVFLNADFRMPQPARAALDASVLEDCKTAAVWRFAIDALGTWFRLVELGGKVTAFLTFAKAPRSGFV